MIVPVYIAEIKMIIDNFHEKEMVFWDGELFYSRKHCHEITVQEADEWAKDILGVLI